MCAVFPREPKFLSKSCILTLLVCLWHRQAPHSKQIWLVPSNSVVTQNKPFTCLTFCFSFLFSSLPRPLLSSFSYNVNISQLPSITRCSKCSRLILFFPAQSTISHFWKKPYFILLKKVVGNQYLIIGFTCCWSVIASTSSQKTHLRIYIYVYFRVSPELEACGPKMVKYNLLNIHVNK